MSGIWVILNMATLIIALFGSLFCYLTDRREVIRMDGTRSEAASNLSVSTRPNWSWVNHRLDPVTQYSSDPGLDLAADPAGVRDQDQARIHHLNKRNDLTLQPTDSLWVWFVYLLICLFFLTLHSIWHITHHITPCGWMPPNEMGNGTHRLKTNIHCIIQLRLA